MLTAEISHLYKTYRRGGFWNRTLQENPVLQDVSLQIGEREIVGLVGESGCGKSTLAKVLLGLEDYDSGTVKVAGKDLYGLSRAAWKALRREMGVVFQDPYGSLDPRQSVRQIICEGWDIHDLYQHPAERQAALQELLQSVGLNEAHLARYPHEFSGGQRQRIALARALALSPKLLVADEPVSALDVSVQAQILNLLKEISRRRALSMLFISHDFAVARFLCDRIAVMYRGRIVEIAPAQQLLSNPQHPYTEALLSAVPQPDLERRTAACALLPRPVQGAEGPCPYAQRCGYYHQKECAQPFALHPCATGHVCACARLPFAQKKSAFAV